MPDPSLFGWHWEPSTEYRARTVRCPHRETQATILAASWKTSGERWTSWQVVDCSLMPAGVVACDMSCASQLEAASYRVVT